MKDEYSFGPEIERLMAAFPDRYVSPEEFRKFVDSLPLHPAPNREENSEWATFLKELQQRLMSSDVPVYHISALIDEWGKTQRIEKEKLDVARKDLLREGLKLRDHLQASASDRKSVPQNL